MPHKKTDHHRWQTFHTSWIKYTWNRNRHLIVNPCIMRSLPWNFLYRRQMSIVLKLIKMNDVCKTIWIRITTSKFVGVWTPNGHMMYTYRLCTQMLYKMPTWNRTFTTYKSKKPICIHYLHINWYLLHR